MSRKTVTARCEYPGCNEIVHEWKYKKGDNMDNDDYCVRHRKK